MAVKFFCGAELGNTVELNMSGSGRISVTAGAPVCSRAWSHTDPDTGWGGEASFAMVASDQFTLSLASTAAHDEVVGFAIRPTVVGAFAVAFSIGGSTNCSVRFDTTTGTISLFRGTIALGTLLAFSDPGIITVGTTYWVTIAVNAAEAVQIGRLFVKLNGVTVVDTGGAGTDCRETTTNHWDAMILTASTGEYFIDDIVYADASGIPAECYAIRRAPAGNGTLQGSPSSGTSNYLMVDESVPSTTDYVTFTTGERDLYTLTDMPGTATGVLGVQVTAQVRVTGLSVNKASLKSGATTLDQSFGSTSGSFVFLKSLYVTDPATGSAWTVAAAEAVQAGVEFETGAGTGDCAWLAVVMLTTGGTLTGVPLEASEQPPYRALIVPDPRFTADAIWADESSYSAVGPRPGVPVDQGDVRSRMVLQATGTQEAAGGPLITAARAGYPDDGAGFVFDPDSTDVATLNYGWDAPAMLTGFEWVNFSLNAGTAFRAQQPHLIRLQSGDLLGCARVSGTGATGSTAAFAPGAFRLDGDTGTWAFIDTIASDGVGVTGALTEMTSPCLLQLPSGRVLCFFWRLVSSSQAQIQMCYSDDDGTNWSVGSLAALDDPVDDFTNTSYSRLRAAYSNGQILLLGCPDDPGDGLYLRQWASVDDGATFSTVWTQNHLIQQYAYPEVIADKNGFDVYFVDLVGEDIKTVSIGSAFDSIGDTSPEQITGALADVNRDLAVWQTEDGTRFLIAPSADVGGALGGGNIFMMASQDDGDTWVQVGNPTENVLDGGLWMPHDDEARLENYSIAECRGRSYMLTEVAQPSSSFDLYSILCLPLGGHTDVTHPCFSEYPTGNLATGFGPVGWRITWAAFASPSNLNDVPTFTLGSGGAATAAMTSDGWQIVTSGGVDLNSYTATNTLLGGNDIDDTLVAMIDVRVTAGGSLTAADAALRLRSGDGVDTYLTEIRMTTSGFRLWDTFGGGGAGAQVDADEVVDMDNADGVQIYLMIGSGGVVYTMYRVYSDGASHPLRDFVLGPNGVLTSNTATPSSTRLLQWGSLAIGSNATSIWRMVCFTSVPAVAGLGADHWTPVANGGSNIDRKFVRPLSSRPVTLTSGVAIRAVDGPCYRGDSWVVPTRFEHPVENLFTPSPRQTFETAQMSPTVVAWLLDSTTETTLTSSSIGLALLNTNARFFTVSALNSATWTTIATVVNGPRNLRYVRNGNTVTVDVDSTTAAGIPWFTYGSAVGAYAVLDDGSFIPTTEWPRRIISNSEGRWNEADGRRVTLILDPDEMDGTEPTEGDLGIVYRDVVVLMHDVTTPYSAWRISIPDQDYPPSDGDNVRIGSMVFGPLAAFGKQYSASRALETSPNAELSTRRSGSRVARELGPARQTVEVSWLEGIDQSQLWYAGTTSPDTIVATTYADSQPIAAPADTAYLVAGLVGEIGPVKPVVYLPRVPVEEGDGGDPVYRVMYLPNTHMYARIANSARTEVVLGDELESDVVRVISLVLEKEL